MSYQDTHAEMFERVIEPDMIMPSQYFDQLRGKLRTPLQRFYFAILQDGIQNATRRDCSPRQLKEKVEAKAWISGQYEARVWAKDHWEQKISFDDCCAAVTDERGEGINPGWLRKGIRSLKGEFKLPRQGPVVKRNYSISVEA